MDNTNLKILKAYLRPNIIGLILACAFILMFPTMVVILMIQFQVFSVKLLGLGLIGAALFAIPLRFMVLGDFLRWHRYFKDADDANLKALLHDFETGKILAEDCIRMGDTYMIGYQAVVPQRYDMTNRVYEYTRSRYGQIINHQLIIRTHIGQEDTLCVLHKKCSEEEVLEIYKAIKEKKSICQNRIYKIRSG